MKAINTYINEAIINRGLTEQDILQYYYIVKPWNALNSFLVKNSDLYNNINENGLLERNYKPGCKHYYSFFIGNKRLIIKLKNDFMNEDHEESEWVNCSNICITTKSLTLDDCLHLIEQYRNGAILPNYTTTMERNLNSL